MMRSLALFLAVLPAAGVAQAPADPDITIAAARSQQGLLEYCADQGHGDGAAAQAQARVIASFPPPRDAALAEEAYRKGRAGVLSAMGRDEPLQTAATGQGASLGALCDRLAETAKRAAAQLSQP